MAFTDTQNKALKAKLSHRHVKTRASNGANLAYVEGWHAITEANRIFGFDSWDRQTLLPRCLWSEKQSGQTVCFYSTKVRITVRAGATVTSREGIGTGIGRSNQPEVAHELAAKASETDATKRALATFGNPFGLALYDRDQSQVTKPRGRALQDTPSSNLVLILEHGRVEPFENEKAFLAATHRAISQTNAVDSIYAFWSENVAAFTELRRRSAGTDVDPVAGIIEALKKRLRDVGGQPVRKSDDDPGRSHDTTDEHPPGSLLIPKERRIRDRAHLAFVASQPCLVCGRRPAQAHHLRFAQSRAMALKVSDEYTLPLCNTHHDQLHRTGDERAWWARHGFIEPLKIAARLWAASGNRQPQGVEETATPAKSNDSTADESVRGSGPTQNNATCAGLVQD